MCNDSDSVFCLTLSFSLWMFFAMLCVCNNHRQDDLWIVLSWVVCAGFNHTSLDSHDPYCVLLITRAWKWSIIPSCVRFILTQQLFVHMFLQHVYDKCHTQMWIYSPPRDPHQSGSRTFSSHGKVIFSSKNLMLSLKYGACSGYFLQGGADWCRTLRPTCR